MTIALTTLPNGLRIVTDTVPDMDSVAVGIWADAGTRHENPVHNGIAHMVEHMMFKGTARRTAAQIAEEVEDVGGEINAYTSREVTAYHIHVLKEHLPLALDILSDILQHQVMPPEEVERERGVILQEIGMSLDTPDDLVFDNYQETAYPGQMLGAPILGRARIIEKMKRDALMDYVQKFYTPSRLVLSAAGNIGHDEFVRRAAELFNALPPDRDFRPVPAVYRGGEHRQEKDLEQSHVVLGFHGPSRLDDDFYPVMALATLLGGGMSSRLFQEVREKRGLVYSIFSFHAPYHDDGQFAVYAGTGPEKLPELMPVICDELHKVCDFVTESELMRAKAQLRAGLLLSRESMMTRAEQQAKSLIHYGGILNVQDKLRQIGTVTADDVVAAARKIFCGKPTLAALGPLSEMPDYETIAGKLA